MPTDQVLLISWLILNYLAIFIGWRFPGHYHLPVLLPLCVLAGQAFSDFLAEQGRIPQPRSRWIRAAIIAAAVLPATAFLIGAFVVRPQTLNFLRPVRVGETANIPIGALHRVENRGPELLIFIEIQRGDYLGEDDIVRISDDYGREK